jgi:hypothetical protein
MLAMTLSGRSPLVLSVEVKGHDRRTVASREVGLARIRREIREVPAIAPGLASDLERVLEMLPWNKQAADFSPGYVLSDRTSHVCRFAMHRHISDLKIRDLRTVAMRDGPGLSNARERQSANESEGRD